MTIMDERWQTAGVYEQAQRDHEFALLRSRRRRFVFPMTVLFLAWSYGYVLLSCYARDLMATPLLGYINIGIVLGFLQFVTTFVITWLYVRYARRMLDPLADNLRRRIEDAR